MSDLSSMTKADLLKEVGALSERLALAQTAAVVPSPPRPVPEAVALGECIRAINSLEDASKNRYRDGGFLGSYAIHEARDTRPVARLLRALADRYDVDLITVQTEPCNRTHVDQLDPQQISMAIQQVSGGAR